MVECSRPRLLNPTPGRILYGSCKQITKSISPEKEPLVVHQKFINISLKTGYYILYCGRVSATA